MVECYIGDKPCGFFVCLNFCRFFLILPYVKLCIAKKRFNFILLIQKMFPKCLKHTIYEQFLFCVSKCVEWLWYFVGSKHHVSRTLRNCVSGNNCFIEMSLFLVFPKYQPHCLMLWDNIVKIYFSHSRNKIRCTFL